MTSSTWTPHARRWRDPLALLALTELGYLLYFHVVASVPHTVQILAWLPFGRWVWHGPVSTAIAYTCCLGGLIVVYAALLKDLTRRGETRRDGWVVFGGAALFGATLIFLPRLLSKDLFDYLGHARVMTVHHANPFTVPADSFGPDEFTGAMGWVGSTPLYGPAWASVVSLLTLLGGGSFIGSVIVLKLFLVAVHLANGWLVLNVARGWNRDGVALRPLRSAAFYLWNPLVVTQTAGDGHNDAVMLFCMLLAILMLQRRDDLLGAACMSLSAMIKYVTAPVVLLMAIHEWRQKGARRAAIFVGVCAAVSVLAYGPYLGGFNAAQFLRPYEHSSYQGSLMMLVEMLLGHFIFGANTPGSPQAYLLLGLSLAAAAALGVWFIRACAKTVTLRDVVENGTRLLLLYLLLVTALLRTSYVVWVVGLAAVAASVTLRRAVAVFSCTGLSLQVVWVWRLVQPVPGSQANPQRFAATVVAVGVPILYLLLHSRGWPVMRGRWGRFGERETV